MALIRTNKAGAGDLLDLQPGNAYLIGIDNTEHAFPITGSSLITSNRWVGLIGNVKGYTTFSFSGATASCLSWVSGIKSDGSVVSLGRKDGASASVNVADYDYVLFYSSDTSDNTLNVAIA